MDAHDLARIEYYRRWLRPDWRRWQRPDWERHVNPAEREAMRKDFALRDLAFETPLARRWRKEKEEREREEQEALEAAHQREIEREALEIKAEIAALRFELAWAELCRKYGYNPSQPRVPAGNSTQSGRWTDGQNEQVRLAASDKLPTGRLGAARLAYQVAKRLIDAYRSSDNFLYNLFGEKRGTVSVTTIDGKDVYGANRGSRLYDRLDEQEWRRLRDALVAKEPAFANDGNPGEMPLNALTHAETNVLLRAARENGGTLAGRQLEVFTDRRMCNFCPDVLPYVGLELGDPKVTFIGPDDKPRTMKGGKWINVD